MHEVTALPYATHNRRIARLILEDCVRALDEESWQRWLNNMLHGDVFTIALEAWHGLPQDQRHQGTSYEYDSEMVAEIARLAEHEVTLMAIAKSPFYDNASVAAKRICPERVARLELLREEVPAHEVEEIFRRPGTMQRPRALITFFSPNGLELILFGATALDDHRNDRF